MRKTLLLTAAFIVLVSMALWPQDTPETVYVIRETEFVVDGISNPYYLAFYGGFIEGERLNGKGSLDEYIARHIQNLNNQRVLDNTATRIEYSLGEPESDGAIPVNLLIHVKDTWNFIVLPYPKYDSNDGLTLTLKARDYNFLGTMNPLRIDLGYNLNNDDKHTFNFLFDSNTPFRAFDLDWNLNFDHELKFSTYDFNLENGLENLYYRNVTGLSVRVPWEQTNFYFGFNHFFTVNQEIDSWNRWENDEKVYYDPYAAIEAYANWGIPLGIAVGDYGGLYYSPGLSGKINYYSLGLPIDNARKPSATFSHSLGFGRVDWVGNFRKGLSASLYNAFTWNIDRRETDALVDINFNAVVSYYQPFNEIFGMTARVRYNRQLKVIANDGLKDGEFDAGDVIRGVINNHIRANYMLSLNLDFPVRVLRFWPSEWFNKDKLRYFNFEMFFSPFLDLAMLEGPKSKLKNDATPPYYGETQPGFVDTIATTGLEVIVFPGITRSLLLRGSVGYDINKVRERGLPLKWGFFPQWDEIYIGVDLYY